jgi:hypothetical protein
MSGHAEDLSTQRARRSTGHEPRRRPARTVGELRARPGRPYRSWPRARQRCVASGASRPGCGGGEQVTTRYPVQLRPPVPRNPSPAAMAITRHSHTFSCRLAYEFLAFSCSAPIMLQEGGH